MPPRLHILRQRLDEHEPAHNHKRIREPIARAHSPHPRGPTTIIARIGYKNTVIPLRHRAVRIEIMVIRIIRSGKVRAPLARIRRIRRAPVSRVTLRNALEREAVLDECDAETGL